MTATNTRRTGHRARITRANQTIRSLPVPTAYQRIPALRERGIEAALVLGTMLLVALPFLLCVALLFMVFGLAPGPTGPGR